jgi:hydrogenase/urease accessory protein HupE
VSLRIVPRHGIVATAAVVAFFPRAAHAHLVSTGMGPFYDGMSHVFLTPDDLLGIVALALFSGLSGRRFGRHIVWMLPGSWIGGGLLGLLQPSEMILPVATALSCLGLGVLLAAHVRVPLAALDTLAVVFGIFHGYLNGTTASEADLGITGLLGIAVAVFVLTALLSAFAASIEREWMKVALRVAGSWIAAIGLLMVGWALRA